MYSLLCRVHGAQSTLQQTENVRTSLTASINGISSSVAGQQATLTAEVAATLNSHALAANASLRVMEQQLASSLLAINASLVAGLAASRPKTGYMQASASHQRRVMAHE